MAFYRLSLSVAMLCAVLAAAPTALRAENIYKTISPVQLEAIFATQGVNLAIDTEGGDATLEGKVSGKFTSVFFYDCDGEGFTAPAQPASDCLGYEFRSYFSGYVNDDATLSAFNGEYHYGKLARDSDGDLALNFTVLVEGGVTASHMVKSLEWWREILEDFDDFMEER